jgi:hypothetical protein
MSEVKQKATRRSVYNKITHKDIPTTQIGIKDPKTIEDLTYIKGCIEEETGLVVSYQNTVNYLIKYYLAET